MITEQDLQAAIAECKGHRNPNASTCIKLAAFYTIKEHLFPSEHPAVEEYSYAPPPAPVIEIDSGSEFAEAVRGKEIDEVMPVIDELMDAIKVLNMPLYASVLRKLR